MDNMSQSSSEELWERCQAVRASRRVQVETVQKTVRINLLARVGRMRSLWKTTEDPNS